jgi:lipopolysaccharide transport system ATP-binding protein
MTGLRSSLARLRDGSKDNQGRDLWALKDVSFEVAEGEVLGIIGRNGAGKSTLLKILSRITEPTTGAADVYGRVGSLLEVGTGFHPELTGRENIYLSGTILGMSRQDIRRQFDEIVDFAELGAVLDTPVKRYSSGMYMRLAFSVAAHLQPDVLMIDEVLAVGDANFQQKCLGKMNEVAEQGRTVLFVSHNMAAVQQLCDRAILLQHGHLVAQGDPAAIVASYLHNAAPRSRRLEWTESQAPGDEHIRLRAVTLHQQSDPATGVFSTSLPLEVRIECDVLAPHSALTIGLAVLSGDSHLLFWSFHTDPYSDAPPALAPGRNVVTCTLPPGLLNAGTYELQPLLSLHKMKWIVNGEATIRFDTRLDHPRSPFWYDPRPGPLAPSLAWRIGNNVDKSGEQRH